MTAIPLAPSRKHPHGASMVLLGGTAALVVVDAAVTLLAGVVDPLLFTVFTLALVAMTGAGAALVRDRRHGGLGRLLLGVAAAGAAVDLLGTAQGVGPAAFLEGILYWGYAGLLAHLVARWPDTRLAGPVVRGLVVAMYAAMPLLSLAWQLTWDVRWFGGEARDWWWLTAVPAREASDAIWRVQQILFVAVIGALLVVVAARVAAARGARRTAMAPVAVAAVALAGGVVLEVLRGLGLGIPLDPALLQSVALLAIPVAVAGASLRAPAGIDEPDVPGRRRLDGAVRDRYHLGLAALGAALVVAVAVAIVAADGTLPAPSVTAPGPAPGPTAVAPGAS